MAEATLLSKENIPEAYWVLEVAVSMIASRLGVDLRILMFHLLLEEKPQSSRYVRPGHNGKQP